MAERRVVVDGSNIATEGRAMPSLAQLRDAVAAYAAEHPDDVLTVVVDASFSYRIDEPERASFEEARTTGELVSPPAGAVGRGDGFLLQIADRTDAVVLSNDSFQEYHGTYEWLFDKGRLIGGTPVPGVGWIFSLRTPVRGPRSREAVKEAKKRKRATAKPIEAAIAEATEDVLAPGGGAGGDDGGDGASEAGGRRRRRRRGGRGGGGPSPEAVNAPGPFLDFVASHKLGSEVSGIVERFSSHGAFVTVDQATGYIPLSAMGEPPPRAARQVLHKGETREFVLQALDAPRRGIELALPGFARVAGQATEETVEAEIAGRRPKAATGAAAGAAKKASKRGATATKKVAGRKAAPEPVEAPADAATPGRRTGKKATAKKVTTKRAATKKAPAAAPASASAPADERAAAPEMAPEVRPAPDAPAVDAPRRSPGRSGARKTGAAAPPAKATAKKAAKTAKKAAATNAAPTKATKGAKTTKATKATKATKPTKPTKKAAATKAGAADERPAKQATATKTATKKAGRATKAAGKREGAA